MSRLMARFVFDAQFSRNHGREWASGRRARLNGKRLYEGMCDGIKLAKQIKNPLWLARMGMHYRFLIISIRIGIYDAIKYGRWKG
jgi:hypothetical protein